MADIVHRVEVRAEAPDVLRAVAGGDLLRAWWKDARFAVDEPIAATGRVSFRCTEGHEEWIGTAVVFDLARDGRDTIVRFRHENWRDASDHFAHCSTKWAKVLFALKARVETPEAEDVRP